MTSCSHSSAKMQAGIYCRKDNAGSRRQICSDALPVGVSDPHLSPFMSFKIVWKNRIAETSLIYLNKLTIIIIEVRMLSDTCT